MFAWNSDPTARHVFRAPSACHTLGATSLLLGTLLFTAGASAQVIPAASAAPTVAEGSRIRITSESKGLDGAKGEVLDINGDRILVQLDRGKGRVGVPLDQVDAMDVSVDQHRNVAEGMAIGALGGIALGAVLGLSAADDGFFTPQETAMILGTGLGLIGGVVGLVAGALTLTDEWAPSSVGGGTPSIAPMVTSSGAGLAVSLRF